MEKTGVAVIGCGRIACSTHIPAYAKNPLAEIKFLVDIIEERAVAQAEKYSVPHTAARSPWVPSATLRLIVEEAGADRGLLDDLQDVRGSLIEDA